MKKFWMVYLEGCRAPVYRHDTEQSAQAEAMRLSKEFGSPAFVLEAKTKIQMTITALEKPPEDEIPF